MITEEQTQEFWAKVDKRGPDDCWPWLGSVHSDGHGQVSSTKRLVYGAGYAHRIAWRLTNGPISIGLCILHHCDNPPCCNPKHLFSGTHADNVKDKVSKNRQLSGENSPRAVLTVDEVKTIRSAYVPGVLTQRELAVQFGVTQPTISAVLRGHNWKAVEGIVEFENVRKKITRHERNGNSRLTTEQVKSIREVYAAGNISQATLAIQYGVVQGHISKIILGQAWRFQS